MIPRTYASPEAFKQALEQRLRSSARTGAEFTRRRQLLVFDRFLARIVAVLGDAAGGVAPSMRARISLTSRLRLHFTDAALVALIARDRVVAPLHRRRRAAPRAAMLRSMQARASDTSRAAHDVQVRVWSRIGAIARLSLAAAMSDEVAEVARLGVASRHAHYSPDQVRLASLRSRLGDTLFRRAFPNAPLLDP